MDVTFRAYFTEGKNIGDFNLLWDLAYARIRILLRGSMTVC